jgi:uncharacterized protein (TIGR02598 family)
VKRNEADFAAQLQQHSPSLDRWGFSLVEVVMALGIFSFVIISIIGLMGSGLKASQDSIRDSTQARIFEQVAPLVRAITNAATTNGATNFTVAGQIAGNVADAIYTAKWTDESRSQTSGPISGLRANKVWKVIIERYGVADSSMATNFVMLSIDPKDL